VAHHRCGSGWWRELGDAQRGLSRCDPMARGNLNDYHRERSGSVEALNRALLSDNGKSDISHLNARFKRITRRYERAIGWRGTRAMAARWLPGVLIGAAAGGCLYLAIWMLSPWPVGVTIRHFAAGANCSSARAVGLAPALRGAPGYWSKNDADNDGIACEPWPRQR
jgi:hypothetical protein